MERLRRIAGDALFILCVLALAMLCVRAFGWLYDVIEAGL